MSIGSGNPTVAQKVALDSHLRDLSMDISDAATVFKAWLAQQDNSIKKLAGDIDLAEIYELSKRIMDVSTVLYDQLRTQPGITNIADAIALLEMDEDPPIAAVTAALRALAEGHGNSFG
jgi:hypothetical protein